MSNTRRKPRRSSASTPANPIANRANKRNRSAELEAFVKRFPVPGRVALGFTLAGIVLGNAYLFWRIWQGDLSVTGLILLVVVEGVLLSLLEAVQRGFVPTEHRMRHEAEQMSLPNKAVGWAGFIVGIGGAYLLWIYLAKEIDVLVAYGSDWRPWHATGLDVAVSITLMFAVVGLFADHTRYRRNGPPLVSTVSMEAMTRRITFAYGAIVIAIPMFGLTALAFWLIKRIVGQRDDARTNLVGGLAVIAAFFGLFFALAHTIDSGPRGWAFVYLLGKIIVESLFALLPLLAIKVDKSAARRTCAAEQ